MGAPSPAKPPTPKEDPEIARARAEEAARRRSGRGYRSTIASDLASQFMGGAKQTFGA
jgi:hypothetical protein